MGTKKRTNHWCNVFFVVCLVIIVLSNVYMTGFASHVLCLYSCSVLCDYLFSVIDQRSCGKQCCNLVWFTCERVWARDYTSCNLTMRVTYFVLEQGQHSYSCSLVPRPTSSFDCLQCVKQIMASYPGPGYNSPIPTIAPPSNTCQCRNTGVVF